MTGASTSRRLAPSSRVYILNYLCGRPLGPNELVSIVLGWDTESEPLPTGYTTTVRDVENGRLNLYDEYGEVQDSRAAVTSIEWNGDFTIVGVDEERNYYAIIADTYIGWITAEHATPYEANKEDLPVVDQACIAALQGDMNSLEGSPCPR